MKKMLEFFTMIFVGLLWLLFNEPLSFLAIIGVPIFFIVLGIGIAQIF